MKSLNKVLLRTISAVLIASFCFSSKVSAVDLRQCVKAIREIFFHGTPNSLSYFSESKRKAVRKDLPEDSDLIRGQPIPPFAYIRHTSAEQLIILKSPDFDPVLVNWLENVKADSESISEPLKKANMISERVIRILPTPSLLMLPSKKTRFEELIKREKVLLGDFIQVGAGVCRHKAVLLQLAFQEAGLDSRIVYGEAAESYLSDGKTLTEEHPHAWVELRLADGSEYIFDPETQQNGKVFVVTLGKSLRVPKKNFVGEDTYLIYGPYKGSVLNGVKPLSKMDLTPWPD
ncbi:MAG: hypothetical protein JWQ35_2196 [Bacteriovoracaceae bacterium]|nr:hypothetical protein [Bacteriovoracaceae bacterium]